MPRLIILARNSNVRQFNIEGPSTSIGRATNNRLCIDSERVSRHHAVIQWTGECYTLTDMGSRNGSYVNETRVHSQALCNGDAIAIGDCHLRFLYSNQPVPQAEALRLLTMTGGLQQFDAHAMQRRGFFDRGIAFRH